MFKNLRQLYLIKIEFSFKQFWSDPTGRQYIVYVPDIIENRTAVPSTGGKCVEYDSISIRYMYELIGALASMCHDMACFPQF